MSLVPINELSTIAKFLYYQLTSDTYWSTHFTGRFYGDIKPVGERISVASAICIQKHSQDTKGAFGYRLKTDGIYHICAIIEGTDFSSIEDAANQIDRVFDWQNQLDVATGRMKCQQDWTDPDNSSIKMRILSLLRSRPLRYSLFIDGINYCMLGGEYEISYYQTG